MIGEDYPLPGLASRKGQDPRLLAIQALCQRLAPPQPGQPGGAMPLTSLKRNTKTAPAQFLRGRCFF